MLEEKLKTSCKSPIVFTHNDLLLANIVINQENEKSSGRDGIRWINFCLFFSSCIQSVLLAGKTNCSASGYSRLALMFTGLTIFLLKLLAN